MSGNRKNYDALLSRMKERYRRNVESGCCGSCGKPLEGSGKSLCPKCLEDRNKNTKRYYRSHKQEISMKQTRRYWERKDAGVCVTCGKVPATATSARCPECSKKQYEAAKRYAARLRALEKECVTAL